MEETVRALQEQIKQFKENNTDILSGGEEEA